MREAGLPLLSLDVQGEHFLLLGSKALVRAVHPERHRVDLETAEGAYLREVLVLGPYFPEVHAPDAPSHAVYLHVRGQAEAFCWPETHRRLMGPQDALPGLDGAQPERRFFHDQHYVFRLGDITLRVSRDNRFVVETEAGDYLLLDRARQEIRLHAPSVFVGTTEQGRSKIEYEQDDSIRAFAPLVLLGTEVGDRIEYREGAEIILQAPLIKLTAEEIILDPVSIKFGHGNATERVVLGDLLMAFYNTFVTLFNAHTHSNVQNGPGTSGAPVTPTATFTDALLSDVARVSKTGL